MKTRTNHGAEIDISKEPEATQSRCSHTLPDGRSAVTDVGFVYSEYECQLCGKRELP